MKLAILFCSIALVLSNDSWEDFKVTYGKIYANAKEEAYRRVIFEEHQKFVEEHNSLFAKGEVTFTVAINKFADLTLEEFKAQLTRHNGIEKSEKKVFKSFPEITRSDSIDWREKGAVTPVKDQGMMGKCSAFSATASLEGAWFIKTGKLIELSYRQLEDCVEWNGVQPMFDYIRKVGGIDSAASYGKNGTGCHFNPDGVVCTVKGYHDIPEGDEVAQAEAVHDLGPISVAVDASHTSFQLYSSGVYYEKACSSKNLDHAMAVVGYGTENGADYWIVKNSWGAAWGDQGYINMIRNKNNNCGIATQSCYPIVASVNDL